MISDYSASSVDTMMKVRLDEEFTSNETDNALTALTVLTVNYPSLFPENETFVQPDIQPFSTEAVGVRFVWFRDGEIKRMIRVPIEDLSNLRTLIDTLDKLISLDLAA